MKITFKLESDKKILIMCEEHVIGHIFTPSSSGHNIENAIQICGFEKAFDLWGCGVFGEKGVMKKDIQLLFKDYKYDERTNSVTRVFDHRADDKCYNEKCSCNELRIYSEKELKDTGELKYKQGSITEDIT